MDRADLAAECSRVFATLDTTTAAWVVGAGRLDTDDDAPAGELTSVLADAHATGLFPTGALAFGRDRPRYDMAPPYRRARIDMDDDAGRPFISVVLELAPGGLVIVAGTRHPGGIEAGDVLLADVEAGLNDLLVFLDVRARQLGCAGRAHGRLEIRSDVPGRDVRIRRLDEETGRPGDGLPFDGWPLEFEFTTGGSPTELESAAYGLAARFAQRFGLTHPDLLGLPDTVPDTRAG